VTPKDVMSVKEACAYLAMDEAALNALVSERRIPCMQVDGAWMFSKKSLDKWRTQRSSATR
jgi:excisionase family DNA binding protein